MKNKLLLLFLLAISYNATSQSCYRAINLKYDLLKNHLTYNWVNSSTITGCYNTNVELKAVGNYVCSQKEGISVYWYKTVPNSSGSNYFSYSSEISVPLKALTIYMRTLPTSSTNQQSVKLTVSSSLPFTPTIAKNGSFLLSSSSATGNQWYNQNGIINGAINQDYTPTENGNYFVVTTVDGCSSVASNTINYATLSNKLKEEDKGYYIDNFKKFLRANRSQFNKYDADPQRNTLLWILSLAVLFLEAKISDESKFGFLLGLQSCFLEKTSLQRNLINKPDYHFEAGALLKMTNSLLAKVEAGLIREICIYGADSNVPEVRATCYVLSALTRE